MLPFLQITIEPSAIISLLSLIGVLATVLISYFTYRKKFPSELMRRVESLESRMKKQEELHYDLHTKIEVMANNIEWLKENAKNMSRAIGVESPRDSEDEE